MVGLQGLCVRHHIKYWALIFDTRQSTEMNNQVKSNSDIVFVMWARGVNRKRFWPFKPMKTLFWKLSDAHHSVSRG
jgi:hypothetical protein